MNRIDAVKIAEKYRKHIRLRREAIHSNEDLSRERRYFHEGAAQMALQIFEENMDYHGFGSPEKAIEWDKERK